MQQSDIVFSLPFDGSWTVFWGGDSLDQNHHNTTKSQKYAYDFIVIDEEHKFFRKGGGLNEDYYSYGMKVLSPADGEVIETVNGLRDNKPKELNNFNFIGNYIMIKHNENTFSILGHLKQNSIGVKVGDIVKSGDVIARCGNSGYTTDPHLHFHVQDSSIFAKVDYEYNLIEIAKAKKVYFTKLKVNNKLVDNYSPIRGDIVCGVWVVLP